MKKIEWWIVDALGPRYAMDTRKAARGEKRWYYDNIFNEFVDDVVFPVKIVRKEWVLVNEKVVR